MAALLQGTDLPDAQRQAVAEKLHTYTGLPVDYLLRADLRVTGGEFSKELKLDEGITTGRLDSRYEGPDIDPMGATSGYDPQSDAITSAWNTAINQYLHNDLKYATQATYLMSARQGGEFNWNMTHTPPGRGFGGGGSQPGSVETGANVMPDLAYRMKLNPKMKVMLAGGYYDLATPYFEGVYEMHHLPMPQLASIQHQLPLLRSRPHDLRQGRRPQTVQIRRSHLHQIHRKRQINRRLTTMPGAKKRPAFLFSVFYSLFQIRFNDQSSPCS